MLWPEARAELEPLRCLLRTRTSQDFIADAHLMVGGCAVWFLGFRFSVFGSARAGFLEPGRIMLGAHFGGVHGADRSDVHY